MQIRILEAGSFPVDGRKASLDNVLLVKDLQKADNDSIPLQKHRLGTISNNISRGRKGRTETDIIRAPWFVKSI